MPTFTGQQSILDAALGVFKDDGFTLEATSPGVATLYFKDKEIAAYKIEALNIFKLHEGCRNFLRNTAGY